MKIALIGPYPEDKSCIKGGTESSVFGLAQELTKQHETWVMDYPRVGGKDIEECDGNLKIYRFRTPGNHYQDAVKRICDITALLRLFRPDAVHIHGTNVFCYKMYRWCKKHGVKVMLTVHGLAAVEKRNAIRGHFSAHALYQVIKQTFYERLLLNRVDGCIVDTGYVAEAIKAYRLRHTPTMYVIPQGINERYFALGENTKKDEKVILSVGTISTRKGRLQLLQAFDQVCEQIQGAENVKLVIAGVNKDKPMFQKVTEYIAHSKNKDKIQLYPDIAQDDLLELYRGAYVFALHTQEESQGIVFAEAMAAGLPVVATRVGGVPYVINDADMTIAQRKAIGKTGTGFLGAFNDIDAMANSLVKVLTNEALHDELAKNAQEEAKYYSWQTIADNIVKLYQK